jgi:hypothetical protein
MENYNQILYKYLDEAIDLEQALAELYFAFQCKFPTDAEFWWHMVIKKESHVSVLTNIKSICDVTDSISEELKPEQDNNYKTTAYHIRNFVLPVDYNITRKEALQKACEIEKMAGITIHKLIYEGKSSILGKRVLQRAGYKELSHYEQIINYMKFIDDQG